MRWKRKWSKEAWFPRVVFFTLLVGLVVLGTSGLCGSQPLLPLTPEDLLAASLSPKDVQKLFPRPKSWWPAFPQFNVGFGSTPSGPLPGEQFFIARIYQQVGESANGRVETAMILFDDETTAAEAFVALLDLNDQGGTLVDGPAVGDERRYFTRKIGEDFEMTLRYRVGAIVGRISAFSPNDYEKPSVLGKYAAPVVRKIRALFKGRLRAAPLPRQFAAKMPPDSASDVVGPVMGSAVVPAESWALVDSSGDPKGARNKLRKNGATKLGFRRYGVQADDNQVIEVTLFPFAKKPAAAAWVQEFINGVSNEEPLDAGETGELSAFVVYMVEEGVPGGYELQFAKGRFVGDVFCFAPFADTSSACEELVRQLAEQWFTALPTP